MDKKINIKDYFKYHPPTEERQKKHQQWNDKCMELALLLDELVEEPKCKDMCLFALQQCRMFGNQGITFDELLK